MASRIGKILKPPRRLRVTREGKWFVLMTLIVGAGAINTGNNLLYLLLGMMLGLIILSGVLSELMLQKVTVRRVPSGDAFARSSCRAVFDVHNAKRFFSSYSIEVAEHESRPTRHRRRRTLGLSPEPPRQRLGGGVRDDGDPGPPKALCLRVPPGRRVTVSAPFSYPVRGLHHYVGIDLVTRFPFGFFEKTRPIEDAGDRLVYPAIGNAGRGLLDIQTMIGEVSRGVEGPGGEFFGLREFREGDDRRTVHWKVSARRNQLVRRVYEREDNEAVALHLYNWIAPDVAEEDLRERERALEAAIEEVAGLAVEYIRRGFRVALHTIGEVVAEGDGAGQLVTILRHLAMLRVRRDEKPPELAASSLRNRVLVSTPDTPGFVEARFELCLEAGAA